mmetsp:Transcript_698/g.1016  ORF Transcript_698/g.1016 Transcript_698/m.1016 type:complete len:188 (-) Transcript_698:73-636(-)
MFEFIKIVLPSKKCRPFRRVYCYSIACCMFFLCSGEAHETNDVCAETSSIAKETPPCSTRQLPAFHVNDEGVLEHANFVVQRLKSLSYTGVYNNLWLHSILSAQVLSGTHHSKITKLVLNLSSNVFESRKLVETYNVLIMEDFVNDQPVISSFAIDNFPKMKQEAIDASWEDKLKEHKRRKDEALLR